MGDEVRLGRGWMFWGATLTLTQEGEERLAHVLATLMRGVKVRADTDDVLICSEQPVCMFELHEVRYALLINMWTEVPAPVDEQGGIWPH
jgi:hypothetical protein